MEEGKDDRPVVPQQEDEPQEGATDTTTTAAAEGQQQPPPAVEQQQEGEGETAEQQAPADTQEVPQPGNEKEKEEPAAEAGGETETEGKTDDTPAEGDANGAGGGGDEGEETATMDQEGVKDKGGVDKGDSGTETTEASDEKHPLQNMWHLWMINPVKEKTQTKWVDSQLKVHTVTTVEDFWCLFNNIHGPTKVGNGNDYSLFKDGIKPAWEDPALTNGGRWVAKISTPKVLDDLWLNILLAMIGETFHDAGGDCVAGAVVSVRGNKGQKIALWLCDSSEAVAMKVGRKLHDILLPLVETRKEAELSFEAFNDNDRNAKQYVVK